jgi:hypothetical protein
LRFFCAALPGTAAAAGFVLHQQGRLLDAGDQPLTGAFDITVRIYSKSLDAAEENNKLWEQKYTAVRVFNGVYEIDIGDPDHGQLLDPALFGGDSRWIGIAVGTDAEMTPRLRVGSVASAVRAGDAGTVGGHPPADFAAAAHHHTAAEVTDFATAVDAAVSGEFAPASHVHPSTQVSDFGAAVAAVDLSAKYAPAGSVVSSIGGLSGAVEIAAGSNVTVTPSGQTLTIAASGNTTLAGAQTFTGLKTFAPSSGAVPFAVGTGLTGVVTGLNADLASGVRFDTMKTFTCPSGQFLTGFSVESGTNQLKAACAAPPTPTGTPYDRIVVDVTGGWGDGTTITELQVLDAAGNAVTYTTTSSDAYDSTQSGLPSYWNQGIWGRSNLNNGNTSYTNNGSGQTSTTYFNCNASTCFVRFLVQLSSASVVSGVKLWYGSPENRIPTDVKFYGGSSSTYSFATNIQARGNANLTYFGHLAGASNMTSVTQAVSTP